MIVTLDKEEFTFATYIGAQRCIEAKVMGLKDAHGFQGDGWGISIEGACGELAVAKSLGREWEATVNTFKTGGDVGQYQVRTTSYPEGSLIFRPGKDRESDVFILVIGVAPVFDVVGWIMGSDARQGKWYREYGGRPPAFFVPRDEMRPMSSIPVFE